MTNLLCPLLNLGEVWPASVRAAGGFQKHRVSLGVLGLEFLAPPVC